MTKLSDTLRERGFVYQFSSEKLEEITDGPKRTVYLGVDPTAESIHVGNLVAYMLLRHFAEAGHDVILLLGGGTGLIGDPKPDVERPLLDEQTIALRAERLRAQAQRLLGDVEMRTVNNADWLTRLDLIAFLRDTGKYFTVNNLIKKDAIAARLKSEEGISFTEFSYPLLQAYDFWHLFTKEGCDVQIGGSDQWGNIVAGTELIRRKENKTAYALTIPIITDKATGKKFGKSEGNAVWLDPEMTTPYAFYQFWLNASDESVENYLKLFTLLSLTEISALMEMHTRDKKVRHAQKTLAREVTKLVHGKEQAEEAEAVTEVLFGEASLSILTDHARETLRRAAPQCDVKVGMPVVEVLIASKLASSKREARQFLKDGAVALNDQIIDEERVLEAADFHESIAMLRRGKKQVCALLLS